MTVEANEKFCLVRILDLQTTPSGQQVTDECDCPLAILTDDIIIVSPLMITQPISVVHACSSSCKIIQSNGRRSMLEREEIEVNKRNQVTYRHDVSNKLYCVNIYCIGNY